MNSKELRYLDNLDGEEIDLLYKSIFSVCILIASADGRINSSEIRAARNFVKYLSESSERRFMRFFFKEVEKDFDEKFLFTSMSYPTEPLARKEGIIKDLSNLDLVLNSKVDRVFVKYLYSSLRELATCIAKSAGGFLGFGTISQEEFKLIHLPMIKFES